MRPTRHQGFTLVECIVSLLITGFLLAGFYLLLSAAFSSSQLPSFTLNTTTYAKVPDIGQMNTAINTQVLIQQLQQNADAILVFGGKGSHPASDPTGPSSVLSWTAWPTSLGPGPTLDPALQFSSWDQRSAAAGILSPILAAAGSASDFSVVFVQGLNRIIGIAKQQMLGATFNGSPIHCYDVEAKAFDSAGATIADYSYHVYYPTGEDSFRISPGAEHLWFRYDPIWDRDEEAGALLVFADPHTVAGENPSGAPVLPVSEFSLYLPVVN